MKKNIDRQSGFTLIETLIYIALFAILIGGGITAAYGIIEGSDRTSSHAIVEQEGIFVLRKLNWAMTGATDANVFGSTLTINRGSTVTFSVSASAIEMNSALLTSLNVKASSVSFVEVPAVVGGRPKSVKASFWLTGTKGNKQYFETTKYLR